jgi:hypothetical protein
MYRISFTDVGGYWESELLVILFQLFPARTVKCNTRGIAVQRSSEGWSCHTRDHDGWRVASALVGKGFDSVIRHGHSHAACQGLPAHDE